MNQSLKLLLLCLGLLAATAIPAATPRIEVAALFTDAAVLEIDGESKMLKVGQTFRGVTLIAAYSRTATVEVDGQQMVLGISRRIGSNYQEPEERVVTIQRNTQLQYRTTATINGRQIDVLVDTGANVVALNSAHAATLGIDVEAGIPSRVETASGLVPARVVNLRTVDVGGIRVDNVQATVVEGNYPATILLGMTYLQHVELQENNGVLSLIRAW
jgi:aspartyl protease family protein